MLPPQLLLFPPFPSPKVPYPPIVLQGPCSVLPCLNLGCRRPHTYMTHGCLARKAVAGSPGLRGVIFIAIGILATSRFVLVVLESLRSLLAV